MTLKEWCVALLMIPLFIIGDWIKSHWKKEDDECW